MSDLSRRGFIKLATQFFLTASGGLGLGSLLKLLSYQSSLPKRQLDLGTAENYPVGSRTVLPEVPALLLHTETGFSALSLVCTHLGCTLDESANGYNCPCHGSRFDLQGLPQHGPAKKPMTILQVEQNMEGHLILHVG